MKKCVARDCDQPTNDQDIVCPKHAKIVIEFKKAFGIDKFAYSVLTYDSEQVFSNFIYVDTRWINLSREIEKR